MTSESAEHKRLLERARAFIDINYDQPLDLGQIARQTGFSQYHFIRLFSRAFDTTPHQYLIQRRVQRAKDLLDSSDLSVTDICFAVGFQSLGSFSSLFRRTVGHPPSVYRARLYPGFTPLRVPACFRTMFGIGRLR